MADPRAEDTVPWLAEWRYWLGGAAVLFVIWAVESLRKGDLMWPWPLVPLVVWAAVVAAARSSRPRYPR